MRGIYTITDKTGRIVKFADDNNTAYAFYIFIKNRTGYAEVWYNGECIFKTK